MLKVEGIETCYGNIRALKGIHLDVKEGSVVSIIGANGAGKTTLLKTIVGALKPKAGTISLFGEEISALRPDQLVRKGIALVPEGRAILSRMTVLENLEMGAYHRKNREVKDDMEAVMRRFPVLERRKRQSGGSLSGGEQQMLAIARALLSRPRLLLLDEPSLGLAPIVVADIFRIVREINSGGTTVLLVEQNMKQAMKVSHHTYVLETGKVVLSGTSQELANDPKIKTSYLGETKGDMPRGVCVGMDGLTS